MGERRIRNNRLKRQRELKKNIMLFMLTACFGVTLSFTAGGFLSNAKSDEEQDVSYKYYTSISIEPGDTLLSIASRYMGNDYESAHDYVREVIQMNSLSNDSIQAGQSLVIPYYSHEFIE